MNKIITLKHLQSVLFVMLCAFLSTTFVACSNDDDTLTTQQMLEGNWNSDGGDVLFKSNGQFQMNNSQVNTSGTWVMDGDEWIIVSLPDNEPSTLYIQIVSLNKNNISLKIFLSRDENGNGVNEILELTMDKVGNNNSDNNDSDNLSIVGIWKCMEYVEYSDKECTIEVDRYKEDDQYLEFKKNGTCASYNPDDGYDFGRYKYDSKNKKITIVYDHDPEPESAKVLSLTATTMVLLAHDGVWCKITCKRVSAVGE